MTEEDNDDEEKLSKTDFFFSLIYNSINEKLLFLVM